MILFRYVELIDKIGHIDPLVNVSLAPASSVSVTVYFESESYVKRFNFKSTVIAVKRILSRELVGQPADKFDLYHHPAGASYNHMKLNFMHKTLLACRIRDEDEIYVHLK